LTQGDIETLSQPHDSGHQDKGRSLIEIVLPQVYGLDNDAILESFLCFIMLERFYYEDPTLEFSTDFYLIHFIKEFWRILIRLSSLHKTKSCNLSKFHLINLINCFFSSISKSLPLHTL